MLKFEKNPSKDIWATVGHSMKSRNVDEQSPITLERQFRIPSKTKGDQGLSILRLC